MRTKLAAIAVTLATGLFVAPLAGEGQPTKLARIGYLGVSPTAAIDQPFVEALRELGWIEGRTVAIEYRWSEGRAERLPALAAELVRLKVDVIYTPGSVAAAQAAQRATSTIPIVFTSPADPERAGLVANLARPGGNITGPGSAAQLHPKRLELLKETIPRLARVAVLWTPGNPGHRGALAEAEAAARTLGIQLQPLEVRDPTGLEGTFSAMTRNHPDALLVFGDALFFRERARIVGLAAKGRLPTMFIWATAVEDGGLMSYGEDRSEFPRRAAAYVDRILKGARAGDLPVERAAKFDLAINLKTAKALGLTIPESILARATKVIGR